METGDCYTTDVPAVENASAENFSWSTIKNILTHVISSRYIQMHDTSSLYPIVSTTFPQTNRGNNQTFYGF